MQKQHSMVKRRRFISLSATGPAGLSVLPLGFEKTHRFLIADDFVNHLGSEYRFEHDGANFVAILKEVKALSHLKRPRGLARKEAFSLLFELKTKEYRVEQDVYQVEHSKMRVFSSLVVPVSQDGLTLEIIMA